MRLRHGERGARAAVDDQAGPDPPWQVPGRRPSLERAASESRVAQLSLEDATVKLLALLPSPSSDDLTLPDDVGAATRMLWKQLSPEWTSYGEDEWAAARAQLPAAAAMRRRVPLAAETGGREALLLTDDDLHDTLWAALCRYVSPPYLSLARAYAKPLAVAKEDKDGAKTDRRRAVTMRRTVRIGGGRGGGRGRGRRRGGRHLRSDTSRFLLALNTPTRRPHRSNRTRLPLLRWTSTEERRSIRSMHWRAASRSCCRRACSLRYWRTSVAG